MSGLYALALIGGWLAVSWFLVWSWKITRPFTTWPRRIHLVFGFLVLGSWFAWSFWEAEGRKLYWDYQVWQMCQEDGGVKVFEKVALEPADYDRYEDNGWFFPNKENMNPGERFYTEVRVNYYRKKIPKVSRQTYLILAERNGSRKVLGEYVSYARSGGGVSGPWHESTFHCPPLMRSGPGLAGAIFRKGDSK
ncbi:hypothetical protein SR882_04870 [Guyparkeria halophila]|uniref:DUF4105 domain-containing protein n=1 Tax=Guyparkeria halophila TaxID=47960 RepID=A0ABZ0Z176_9GAMM|nr:hypothetical protein [Guyparkeria halophila]WQH17237.1 hypothetical protein SR882_04870 [Guyparkeria halophila]